MENPLLKHFDSDIPSEIFNQLKQLAINIDESIPECSKKTFSLRTLLEAKSLLEKAIFQTNHLNLLKQLKQK